MRLARRLAKRGVCGCSVHEEGLKVGGVLEGGLVLGGLFLELAAEGGPVADGFAHELAFHPAFVLLDEDAAAFLGEVDAAFFVFEMFLGEHVV